MTALRHVLRASKPWEEFLEYKTNRKWNEIANIREFKFTLEEELKPYVSEKELTYILSKSNKQTYSIPLKSK